MTDVVCQLPPMDDQTNDNKHHMAASTPQIHSVMAHPASARRAWSRNRRMARINDFFWDRAWAGIRALDASLGWGMAQEKKEQVP